MLLMAELPLHGPDLRDSDEDQRLYWWSSENFGGFFNWELFKLYRFWKAHDNTKECSRSHSASPSPYLWTWKLIVWHLFWSQQKLLKQTNAQKNIMAGPLVSSPQVGSRLNEILVPWTLQEPLMWSLDISTSAIQSHLKTKSDTEHCTSITFGTLWETLRINSLAGLLPGHFSSTIEYPPDQILLWILESILPHHALS